MKNTEQKDQKPSFFSKLENFWYYYKIPTILVIIFIVAFLILMPTQSEKIASDLKISLVSEGILNEGTINFNEALPGLIKDINEDGEAAITIHRIFLTKDLKDDNDETYMHVLESQLSNRGATLFIFDKVNFDRMIKKDAFCPLTDFFDVSLYGDRVLYRNEVPVAFHLSGSRVLSEMGFTSDDLYAMLLFRRPGEEQEPERVAEYENAALVLGALMEQ